MWRNYLLLYELLWISFNFLCTPIKFIYTQTFTPMEFITPKSQILQHTKYYIIHKHYISIASICQYCNVKNINSKFCKSVMQFQKKPLKFAEGMLTACYYHATYAFQSESTLYSCLNVKKGFAQNMQYLKFKRLQWDSNPQPLRW